jgi:hypothetical protein
VCCLCVNVYYCHQVSTQLQLKMCYIINVQPSVELALLRPSPNHFVFVLVLQAIILCSVI